MFASLSQVAYCDDLSSVMSWTCTSCNQSFTRLVPGKIRVIDGGLRNATRIVVGKLVDQEGCVLSFRGSSNALNWIRDFQIWKAHDHAPFDEGCEGCAVHAGFYDIWKKVRDLVVNALEDVGCSPSGRDNILYITGHSLGAAMTHMAMFFLDLKGFSIAKTYSFEAPRMGNKAFADAFDERFSRKFPVFRITHYKDPVPHLPPELFGYHHVQREVYYNEEGERLVCDKPEDLHCADQFWNLPLLVLLHTNDHCSSSLVPNGDICSPVGCSNVVDLIV